MSYIAYTVKGLEEIAADEILEKISDATIEEIADKRIVFSTHASYEMLSSLKTVDDIGILICKKEKVMRMDDILHIIDSSDFYTIQQVLSDFRKIVEETYSLTMSLARVKGLKTDEVDRSITQLLKRKYGWKREEQQHTNFDIRLFMDGHSLYLSLRLTQHSLHHRAYRIESREGALRSTIAAAMLRLVTKKDSTLKIVDNFSGSGTILCEALSSGYEVYGGDIDQDAVRITERNLSQITLVPSERLKVQNGMNTKWPDHTFHVAISNLPWNKQIAVSSITDLYIGTLQEYKRILKEKSTLCMLVSKPELFIKHAKVIFPDARIESFKISFTGQSPTIVLITNSGYND